MPPSTFLPAGRDLLGAVVADGTVTGVNVTRSIGAHSLSLASQGQRKQRRGFVPAGPRYGAPALSDFYRIPHPCRGIMGKTRRTTAASERKLKP